MILTLTKRYLIATADDDELLRMLENTGPDGWPRQQVLDQLHARGLDGEIAEREDQ